MHLWGVVGDQVKGSRVGADHNGQKPSLGTLDVGLLWHSLIHLANSLHSLHSTLFLISFFKFFLYFHETFENLEIAETPPTGSHKG